MSHGPSVGPALRTAADVLYVNVACKRLVFEIRSEEVAWGRELPERSDVGPKTPSSSSWNCVFVFVFVWFMIAYGVLSLAVQVQLVYEQWPTLQELKPLRGEGYLSLCLQEPCPGLGVAKLSHHLTLFGLWFTNRGRLHALAPRNKIYYKLKTWNTLLEEYRSPHKIQKGNFTDLCGGMLASCLSRVHKLNGVAQGVPSTRPLRVRVS